MYKYENKYQTCILTLWLWASALLLIVIKVINFYTKRNKLNSKYYLVHSK